ncbi:MAG: mechanosensitive ion channel domain-containing protein [Cyanobacteria bacterium J06597_16]
MNAEKMTELMIQIQPFVLGFLLNAVLALVIFGVGRWLARFAKRLVKKGMTKAQVEPTLTVFASNILFYVIMAFVVLAALGAVGIETTSLIAALGAAGLAIGLALQGSLTNFAAGIIIIIFQPFRVGDWVEVDGHSGYIMEIELLTTSLRTLDNRTVILPNGALTENSLVNYSTQGKLRLDLVVGVDYTTDIDRVKQILLEVLTTNERVLQNPKPTVGLLEMADSSLNFAVRPWVAPQDYEPQKLAIHEAIKKRLDSESISIPFPQRDVHLFETRGLSSEVVPTVNAN